MYSVPQIKRSLNEVNWDERKINAEIKNKQREQVIIKRLNKMSRYKKWNIYIYT